MLTYELAGFREHIKALSFKISGKSSLKSCVNTHKPTLFLITHIFYENNLGLKTF